MDDEERAREEREQVVNPNRHSRVKHCCKGRHCCRDGSCQVIEEDPPKLWARCPACMGDIAECDDCGGWLAAIEPKPEGYADASQWQKDAWDSEINKTMRMAADACPVCPAEAPVCPHNEDGSLRTGGWCAPSHEEVFGYAAVYTPVIPALSVRRGGMRFPWFAVYTSVSMHRVGFWRRKEWRLHVGYWDQEQNRQATHYMQFASEPLARNAEKIIKFTMQTVNEKHWREKDAS